MERALLALIFLSGAALWFLRAKHGHEAGEGKREWMWLQVVTALAFVFTTPAVDYAYLTYKQQSDLEEGQLFHVRSVKLAFVLFSFAMGYVAKVFREQVTNNFAKWERPGAKEPKPKKEKLLLPPKCEGDAQPEEPKSEK